MAEDTEISKELELVCDLARRRRYVQIGEIAHALGRSSEATRELVDEAVHRGLVSEAQSGIELTAEGEALVTRSRKKYVSGNHIHGTSLTGRLRLFLDRETTGSHGRGRHHAFSDEPWPRFDESMQNFPRHTEDTISLTDLGEGEKCTVTAAVGGHRMVRRLAEMGLTPGTEITIVRIAPMHGPVEIFVRGVSLALGRGIATKVLVRRPAGSSASTTN
jgi:ferrous iron transport protein A